jgi:hypothetical protein
LLMALTESRTDSSCHGETVGEVCGVIQSRTMFDDCTWKITNRSETFRETSSGSLVPVSFVVEVEGGKLPGVVRLRIGDPGDGRGYRCTGLKVLGEVTTTKLRSIPVEKLVREAMNRAAFERRYDVHLSVSPDHERWEVGEPPSEAEVIAAAERQGIATEGFRAITWIEDGFDATVYLDLVPTEGPGAADELVRARTPLRSNTVPDELLREVAKLYRSAERAPTKFVADELGVARPTAARYVARARDAGYLGPAEGTSPKGSGKAKKSPAKGRSKSQRKG